LKFFSHQALQGQRKKEEHHLIYEQYNQLIFDLEEGGGTVRYGTLENLVNNGLPTVCKTTINKKNAININLRRTQNSSKIESEACSREIITHFWI
jgi:hypothetical protein